MDNLKLQFFGHLNQAKLSAEAALKSIENLWELQQIRLTEEDLKQMNEILNLITKTASKIKKYNHDRFGHLTNSFVEQKVGK